MGRDHAVTQLSYHLRRLARTAPVALFATAQHLGDLFEQQVRPVPLQPGESERRGRPQEGEGRARRLSARDDLEKVGEDLRGRQREGRIEASGERWGGGGLEARRLFDFWNFNV